MASHKLVNQEKAHKFLLNKFNSQEEFTKTDFQKATGWSKSSFSTYWTKQFKTLLIKTPANTYRVSEAFRRVLNWDAFRGHVSQTRKVATDYSTLTFNNVILFDFFMPLTNEGYLRTSLDSLFYKDSIISRLKTIEESKLEERFPKNKGESKSDYYDRICDFISNLFGGYSISHVNGRYRADSLKTYKDIYTDLTNNYNRYLIDETTAIVRFIFPCGSHKQIQFLSSEHYFDDLSGDQPEDKPNAEAALIRWLFYVLFVQSIVQVVNGEDEIWMLESGMRNRLHIWRVDEG